MILGFAFLVLPFLFNHVDFLFPKFTGDFSLFGNSLSVDEGLNSSDLIWTIVQKSNLILLYIGVFILSPFKKKSKAYYSFITIITLCISYTTYLSIEAFQDYTRGFNDKMFLRTFISIIAITTIVIFTITRLTRSIMIKRRKEILQLKNQVTQKIKALHDKDIKLDQIKTKINTKVESIEEKNFKLVEIVSHYEKLHSQLPFFENLDDWTVHSQLRVKKMYAELAEQLQELEGIRVD